MKKLLTTAFAAALAASAMTCATRHAADDKSAATAPAVTTIAPAPATIAPAPAQAAALIVWDGETTTNAQGWGASNAPFKVQGDVVHAGKQALQWTAKGARCHNGWNWCGWYPADAGTDITAYANLVFWIKVAGANMPADIWVNLVSNNKNIMTQQVGIAKYCPKAFDGEWHEVVMPLKDLYGDKKDFDPKKAWEFDISAPWNDSVFNFVAYLDDIGFAGAPGDAPSALAPGSAAPAAPADAPQVPNAAKPAPKDQGWLNRHEQYVALAKKGGIDLYFEGDSITDGWHGGGRAVWNKEFAGWNPANFGIGGDQTQHVLWRLQNGEFEGVKPKVVVLMIGTNNIGQGAENMAAGVTAIVREMQKQSPTTKILLLAIFPRGEKATDRARAQLKAVNDIIAKLDDGKTVKYMDIGAKFLDADGTLPKSLFPDSLHPNAKGYQIWADAIKPQLTQWLAAPVDKN